MLFCDHKIQFHFHLNRNKIINWKFYYFQRAFSVFLCVWNFLNCYQNLYNLVVLLSSAGFIWVLLFLGSNLHIGSKWVVYKSKLELEVNWDINWYQMRNGSWIGSFQDWKASGMGQENYWDGNLNWTGNGSWKGWRKDR